MYTNKLRQIPVQDSALHFAVAVALRLSVLFSARLSYWGFMSCYIYVLLVQSRNWIMYHVAYVCTLNANSRVRTCQHVSSSECDNQIHTLDQLHRPNSYNLVLYLPAIQLVQITQRPPYRLLAYPPRSQLLILSPPRSPSSSRISRQLNRINYLGRKHVPTTSVSIGRGPLNFSGFNILYLVTHRLPS